MFRPERWLPESYDDGGQRLAAMAKVQELIFGHGMTRCLGIPIAMMNLNKMLVEVSFDRAGLMALALSPILAGSLTA